MPEPSHVQKKALKHVNSRLIWNTTTRNDVLLRLAVNSGLQEQRDPNGIEDSTGRTRESQHGPDADDRLPVWFLKFLKKAVCSPTYILLCIFSFTKDLFAEICHYARARLRLFDRNRNLPQKHGFIDFNDAESSAGLDLNSPRNKQRRSRSADSVLGIQQDDCKPVGRALDALDTLKEVLQHWHACECREEQSSTHISEDKQREADAVAERFYDPEWFERRLSEGLQAGWPASRLQEYVWEVADDLWEQVQTIIDGSDLDDDELSMLNAALQYGIERTGRGRYSTKCQFTWEVVKRIFKLSRLIPYRMSVELVLLLAGCRPAMLLISADEEVDDVLKNICLSSSIEMIRITDVQKVEHILLESKKHVIWYIAGHMETGFPMLRQDMYGDGTYWRSYKHRDVPDIVNMVTACLANDACHLQLVFVNGCGGNVLGEELHRAGVPIVVYWQDRPIPEVARRFAEGFFLAHLREKIGEEDAFEKALSEVTMNQTKVQFGVSPDDAARVRVASGTIRGTGHIAGGKPKIRVNEPCAQEREYYEAGAWRALNRWSGVAAAICVIFCAVLAVPVFAILYGILRRYIGRRSPVLAEVSALYVTSNSEKYEEAKHVIHLVRCEAVALEQQEIELPELQGDINMASPSKTWKAVELLKHLGTRFIITDSGGLELACLNNSRNFNIKEMLRGMGDARFADLVYKYDNHVAVASSTLSVWDRDDPGRISTFSGELHGNIILKPRGNVLHGKYGWNSIFVPLGYNNTLAEMSLEAQASFSHRRQAFERWLVRTFPCQASD